MKALTLVGLDVQRAPDARGGARSGHRGAGVSKLRMAPVEVSYLEGLGPAVQAVHEARPDRFGLAGTGRGRGFDVRVAAPGSIPKGSDDRVKTDRRDAVRMVRLLGAGELSFAPVPSWPMRASATWCAASRTSAAT